MAEYQVKIGMASCSIAAGAGKVYDLLQQALEQEGIHLQRTGCMGLCYCEPLVEVLTTDNKRYIYGNVTAENVLRVVDEHIKAGKPVADLLVLPPDGQSEAERFLSRQQRFLLHNCGEIDPENISSYIMAGGYQGLGKALAMTPEEVIAQIKESGLRGRGGAGFPTHQKWTFAQQAAGRQKYIICNADEGDPGAFMDRSILESDPQSVL
jgi:NADH-quinone oxidoreductase subunit F